MKITLFLIFLNFLINEHEYLCKVVRQIYSINKNKRKINQNQKYYLIGDDDERHDNEKEKEDEDHEDKRKHQKLCSNFNDCFNCTGYEDDSSCFWTESKCIEKESNQIKFFKYNLLIIFKAW